MGRRNGPAQEGSVSRAHCLIEAERRCLPEGLGDMLTEMTNVRRTSALQPLVRRRLVLRGCALRFSSLMRKQREFAALLKSSRPNGNAQAISSSKAPLTSLASPSPAPLTHAAHRRLPSSHRMTRGRGHRRAAGRREAANRGAVVRACVAETHPHPEHLLQSSRNAEREAVTAVWPASRCWVREDVQEVRNAFAPTRDGRLAAHRMADR